MFVCKVKSFVGGSYLMGSGGDEQSRATVNRKPLQLSLSYSNFHGIWWWGKRRTKTCLTNFMFIQGLIRMLNLKSFKSAALFYQTLGNYLSCAYTGARETMSVKYTYKKLRSHTTEIIRLLLLGFFFLWRLMGK